MFVECGPVLDNVRDPGTGKIRCVDANDSVVANSTDAPVGTTCTFGCPDVPSAIIATDATAYECKAGVLSGSCVDTWVASDDFREGYTCETEGMSFYIL